MHVIEFISPHLDDACFSLALHAWAWTRRGIPLRIISCYTITDYAPNFERPREDVSYIRMAEDEEFAELLRIPGVHVESLSLRRLDAPLRLRWHPDNVCGPDLRPDHDSVEVEALVKVLSHMLRGTAVIVPFGLGGHIDHLVAREASIRAAGTRPIAFYEDLPYANAFAEAKIVSHARVVETQLGRRLYPLVARWLDAPTRKLSLARVYASQVQDADLQAISAHCARYGGGERLWQDESFRGLGLVVGDI